MRGLGSIGGCCGIFMRLGVNLGVLGGIGDFLGGIFSRFPDFQIFHNGLPFPRVGCQSIDFGKAVEISSLV